MLQGSIVELISECSNGSLEGKSSREETLWSLIPYAI